MCFAPVPTRPPHPLIKAPLPPSLLPPKCVSGSSHRVAIPRQLSSSEERGGRSTGGSPGGTLLAGRPAGSFRGARPTSMGPKRQCRRFLQALGTEGRQGRAVSPRAPSWAVSCGLPTARSSVRSPAAPRRMRFHSRTGGRCPGELEARPSPPRAPPPRVLGDPIIISAAVRADDVMWGLFFFFPRFFFFFPENRD